MSSIIAQMLQEIEAPQVSETEATESVEAPSMLTESNVSETTVVDASFLLLCLQHAITNAKSRSEFNGTLPCVLSDRPFVGVYKKGTEKAISTTDELIELFSEVTHITPENTYVGYDQNDTIVLRCALPDGYVARVPYVKVRDIPDFYNKHSFIVVRKFHHPKGGMQTTLQCPEMEPVWTDKEGELKGWGSYYNCITLKIRKDSFSLKAWIPGRDKYTGVCNGLADEYVLCGPHYDKEGKVWESPRLQYILSKEKKMQPQSVQHKPKQKPILTLGKLLK